MKKLLALALVALMAAATVVPMSAGTAVEPVDALYFDEAPEIDGVITAEEWGEPTVSAGEGGDAFYQTDKTKADISMDIYLRWDEEKFYIGVVSPDKDGQSIQAGEGSTWNGDAIQFRLDPKGSNSTGDKNAPFDNSYVPNISCGWLSNDKKFEIYDHAASKSILDVADFAFAENDGDFTWEIAIPHEYVKVDAEAGFEYGLSICRLNAPAGEKYNVWGTWGDGICGPQDNGVRVGSNPVTLSDEPAVIEVVEEAPAADAEAAAPTADASYAMFAILAIVSLAGAVYVTKKSR